MKGRWGSGWSKGGRRRSVMGGGGARPKNSSDLMDLLSVDHRLGGVHNVEFFSGLRSEPGT